MRPTCYRRPDGARMGDTPAVDAMMHDGLLDAFEHVNMIRFGTDGAKKFDISRERQDEWALRSHQRAAAATDDGKLSEEIVGVKVPGKKGRTTYVGPTSRSVTTPPWRSSPSYPRSTRAAP